MNTPSAEKTESTQEVEENPDINSTQEFQENPDICSSQEAEDQYGHLTPRYLEFGAMTSLEDAPQIDSDNSEKPELDEETKGKTQRAMGMKMEQLKAEWSQVEHAHDDH